MRIVKRDEGTWNVQCINFEKNVTRKNFISEVGGESETNETNLVGCQRCLQMPWAAGRVRIANVDKPRLSREENMQNEMKTPTYGLGGRGEWLMRGRELKARHWAGGWRSQLSDEERRGGILNRCYLCSPVPAGFVSVKVGWAENFTKVSSSRFLLQ